MLLDEIGEEKEFEHQEDNEKFDDDDRPQCFPQRHIAEAVHIKVINPIEKTSLSHGCEMWGYEIEGCEVLWSVVNTSQK